jgi:hypothetical protein
VLTAMVERGHLQITVLRNRQPSVYRLLVKGARDVR